HTLPILSLSSQLPAQTHILSPTYQPINPFKYLFPLNLNLIPNPLKPTTYITQHPQPQTQHFNNPLKHPTINPIITSIPPHHPIKIFPFLNLQPLPHHPKIFSPYSHSTTLHIIFYKIPLLTFYPPPLLTHFPQNIPI
ncbi:LD-carboxypeptidase, partial [Staphylococcus saprophyticus]|uniref:LD-carboxypeptidase n=1 Tax=Staphylococcus saprophyticus TaxID=29385 RepID=UPI001782B226